MTTKTTGVSLASLNMRKASEEPFKFEYIGPDGSNSGITLHVLGGHSDTVNNEVNRLLNERRRKEAAAQARQRTGRKEEGFTPVEDDIAFAQRLNAVRLVGWEGITEPWSQENALELIRINPHLADQVAEASGDLSNFTQSSSKTS